MTDPSVVEEGAGSHQKYPPDTGCPGGCARTTGSSLKCDRPVCIYDDPAVIRQAEIQARTVRIRSLLAQGLTRREVAASMKISLGTVVKAKRDHHEEEL